MWSLRQVELGLIRSPTTLQHGRYAYKELEQWYISFYSNVTNVHGSLEAVDCYIHSARYDMVLEYCTPPSKLDPIRSPTTLQHGRYAYKELEQWHISFYSNVTNGHGSLEAADCYIHSARYDIVLQCGGRGKPNWASSGHLRRCSMADTHIKSLSSGIYPSTLS
eukprot:scaffold6471_cov108-Skeletonema_marinoi.AAC.1